MYDDSSAARNATTRAISSGLPSRPTGIATAPVEKGSWWRPWIEWLTARSGPERQAPAVLGNRQYLPLGPAPGTYVYQ